MARVLIGIGILLIVAGLIWHFFGDKLGWIGNLPGDIRVERENLKIYFPITTMILLSLVASLVMWILKVFMD